MSFSASSSPPSSSATSSTSTCSPTLGHDAGAASLAEKAAATSTGDGNAPPKDDIAVKAEPLEAHDNGFWATIFAEGNEVMELLDEDGYASSLDDHVKELSPPLKAPSSEPTTTSAMLEQWNHCESELTLGQTAPLSSPSTTFALPSLYASLEAHHQQTETDVFAQEPQPKLEPGVALPASAPTHALPLGTQRDGTPFPLSKPIVREDGIILVGTELMSDQHQNRIFVTNMHSFHQSRPVASIPVPDSVCDLHWLNDCTAVVAVGKDVQLIRIGSTPGDRSCRLQPPINRVHSDTIREVALAQATTRPHVLSGGFDETVCVTQLDPAGDPKASVVVSKFDAHDVVSSVRWSPTEAQVSWTTDGGDFHMADIRLKPSHTQMPAASVVRVDQMGGLFTHEYLSCTSVVLGFEHGDLVFLDTRMPRASTCYHKMPSQLVSTGEIRRSKMGKLAVFGLSGFSVAEVDASAREFERIQLFTPMLPSGLQQSRYKTSGDFSYQTGSLLAVSDSRGVVSVYNTSRLMVGAASSWRERTV